jgi:hypothetical protein
VRDAYGKSLTVPKVPMSLGNAMAMLHLSAILDVTIHNLEYDK